MTKPTKEPNITCPRCRHRHPASRSCAEAKRLADEARAARHAAQQDAQTSKNMTFANTLGDKVVQNVCELPGYTSPDDQPELLQCTVTELHNAVVCALEAMSANETSGSDAEDAAKWRALRNCARITAMGSASIDTDDPYAHLTLNFWTGAYESEPGPAYAREWLDKFVAKALAAAAARERPVQPQKADITRMEDAKWPECTCEIGTANVEPDCPAHGTKTPKGLGAQIQLARRQINSWPPAVQVAMGLPVETTGQPIAWVPIHPKNGPLWSNVVTSLTDQDRPWHYALMPLYSLSVETPAQPVAWRYVIDDAHETKPRWRYSTEKPADALKPEPLYAMSAKETSERFCSCIPLAPRPWNYCRDCGGKILAHQQHARAGYREIPRLDHGARKRSYDRSGQA